MQAIKILSVIIAIFIGIAIIFYGALYFMYSSPLTVSDFKDTEKIDVINLRSNEIAGSVDSNINVYVTLFNADHDAKKMPDRDTISLNGVTMIPVFHKSNGVTSSRYVYEVTTQKSQILTLSIKRANGEEIVKSIKSFDFKADLPTQISRSKIFSLPYTSSGTTQEALHYSVSIDSLSISAYSSVMDNKNQLILNKEKIMGLKIGKVVLDVAAIYQQDQDLVNGNNKFHGSYSIGYKKVIEIIK